MIQFESLKYHPRVFSHLTGLTLAAFEELLIAFEQAFLEVRQQQEAERSTPRQRKAGAGRKPTLAEDRQQLLFILVYFW